MRLFVIAFLALLGYLLAWPVDIEPQAWQPPEPPRTTGAYAPNTIVHDATRLLQDQGAGGEAVAIDGQGRVYTGFANGDLVRLDPATNVHVLLGNTGGRPLGLALDSEGQLWVADAARGLMRWSSGVLSVELTEVDDVALGFADDIAIARDGTIYLSDASVRFDHHNVRADFFEHGANGRVVAYDPVTGESRVVLDGLYFANGLALSPDQDALLINETSRYRTLRLWLKGPQAGQHEVWASNWPGFPDNIRPASDGGYWLALYAPRNPILDWALPRPFWRRVIWRLPRFLQPDPPAVAQVLRLDAEGEVLHALQGRGEGVFAPITCAAEGPRNLWLGSLSAAGIARLPLLGTRLAE